MITFWNDMASAVTTHPDTSSLSNNRGTDLISLLFSLQTSVAKVKPEPFTEITSDEQYFLNEKAVECKC